MQDGNISFSVGTTVGKTYRVEFKNSLSDANWQPLGADQVATSTSLIITDAIGDNLQRFYQVIELP